MANTWSVIPLTQDSSAVSIKPQIEVNTILWILLFPLKPLIKSFGKGLFEELKYYIENNSPHPRKVKKSKGNES